MSLLTTVLQVSSIFVIRIALQNESNGNEKLSLVYITEPFLVPNTVAIIVMLYNRVGRSDVDFSYNWENNQIRRTCKY